MKMQKFGDIYKYFVHTVSKKLVYMYFCSIFVLKKCEKYFCTKRGVWACEILYSVHCTVYTVQCTAVLIEIITSEI